MYRRKGRNSEETDNYNIKRGRFPKNKARKDLSENGIYDILLEKDSAI
jgi:hypothetical protein